MTRFRPNRNRTKRMLCRSRARQSSPMLSGAVTLSQPADAPDLLRHITQQGFEGRGKRAFGFPLHRAVGLDDTTAKRRQLRFATPAATMLAFNGRCLEGLIDAFDEQPRAAVRHAHAARRLRDRAMLGDQFQKLDTTMTDVTRIIEVEAKHNAWFAIGGPRLRCRCLLYARLFAPWLFCPRDPRARDWSLRSHVDVFEIMLAF